MKIFFSKNLIILSLICIGIFLRFYQINLENYWLDEQASYYSSIPNIPFSETLKRNEFIDESNYLLFTLILKFFYHIFGYDPFLGRYIPLIFGVLSIPAMGYLSYILSNKKNYIFAIFLTTINIYLIQYSQELRPYSFVFFLCLLNLIFFYKLSENYPNSYKDYIFLSLFIIFSLISLTALPFVLVILFSQIFYAFYIHIFFKKKIKTFLISLPIIIILYLLINYDFIVNLIILSDYIKDVYDQPWMNQVSYKFYYNYFFSRFFGSLIMGSIYLISLIYLIIKFKKKIFLEYNKLTLLFFILIFSYIIPLTYGYIKIPILLDRYIAHVLIPIIILISLLIIQIKNKKIKLFILGIITISTVINNFIEIKFEKNSKPEFVKTVNYIQKSNILNYSLKNTDLPGTVLLDNYLKSLSNVNNKEIHYHELEKIPKSISEIWIVCYVPLMGFNCSLPVNFTTVWKKIDSKKFYHSEVYLYKKTKK
jgi:hypothetical protein